MVDKSYTVRIPEEILERAKSLARQEAMSANAFIVKLIDDATAGREIPPTEIEILKERLDSLENRVKELEEK